MVTTCEGSKMKNIRVISKLDLKGHYVIKGLQFDGYRSVAVAHTLAKKYCDEGIDELYLLDSVASLMNLNCKFDVIKEIAEPLSIPITVGGGIRSLEDISNVLRAGADKVAINTAAVKSKDLLSEAVKVFGSQCIVLAVDSYRHEEGIDEVWIDYGRQKTGIKTQEWIKQCVDLGVGEVILTSVNQDGLGEGYDTRLVESIASIIAVPLVACGGAGKTKDFINVIKSGADAIAASSVFLYNYMKPVETPFMCYDEKNLRYGKEIDSGNVEFITNGYGGITEIFTERLSIQKVKNEIKNAGYGVRPI